MGAALLGARQGCALLALGLCALLGALLSGCAPNGGLDVAKLEQELVPLVLPDHPTLVLGVQCPEPLAPSEGDVVRCDVQLGSQTVPLAVTFGQGRGVVASAVVEGNLVDMDEAAKVVAAEFEADLGIPTSVACPQPVMVVPAGTGVTCIATDAAGRSRLINLAPERDGSVAVTMIG